MDEYLSDIHVENIPIEKSINKCISQIEFTLPVANEDKRQTFNQDDDGDLVIKRPAKHKIIIEHNLETNLDNVGNV